MGKKLIMLLTLILGCLIVAGCANEIQNEESSENIDTDELTKTSGDDTDSNEQDKEETWYSIYNLDTEKIIIAVPDRESEDRYRYLKHIIEISDASEVKLISETVDLPSWKKVSPEDKYKGVPYFYLIFDNGTIVSMYYDIAYGCIREYSVKDNKYTYTNTSDDYIIPENLLKKIWELVEPYSDQLDVEPYSSDSK